MLLLTLKERYKLTQTAVDFVLSQVKETVSLVTDEVKKGVKNSLADVDEETIDKCFETAELFDGLETEHMQTRFYQEHFGLIVSLLACTGEQGRREGGKVFTQICCFSTDNWEASKVEGLLLWPPPISYFHNEPPLYLIPPGTYDN